MALIIPGSANKTSLIIPDSVKTAPAGSRLALAMAKSKFDAEAKSYKDKGSRPIPSRLRALRQCFDGVERAFMAMLKDHPQRDQIGECVASFVKFGGAVTQLERQHIPAFHPVSRPIVATLFQMWEAAEKDYAAMGFRTVPARDIFLSLMPLGSSKDVHPPLYTFLMIERDPNEEPVFHAAAFAAHYAKDLALGIEEAKAAAEKGENVEEIDAPAVADAPAIADALTAVNAGAVSSVTEKPAN